MYGITALRWYMTGMRSYVASGYERHAAKFEPGALDVDMKGKVAMVTGANQGMGYCTAEALAQKGCTVHLVCRNRERGETAQKQIVEKTGNKDVHLLVADMSSVTDVKSLADEYVKSGQKLHILVNNAGGMVEPRALSKDGMEMNFATNTLAPFVLTSMLLPVLRLNAPSRVITVSSGGMLTEALHTQDMEWASGGFSGTRQYARDKRRQVAYTEWWAEQPENKGVQFYTMHPGWAGTEALKKGMTSFYESTKDKLRTPEQAADTVIWLSVVPDEKLKNGAFYFDRMEAAKHISFSWTEYSKAQVEELVKSLRAAGKLE